MTAPTATHWSIADVITTTADRLARLTSADYTIDIIPGFDLSPRPSISVQVGHWLPSDDARIDVIRKVVAAVSDTATWYEAAYVYENEDDSGALHLIATIDGVEWDVWAALHEPGRAQAEAARLAAAEAGAA